MSALALKNNSFPTPVRREKMSGAGSVKNSQRNSAQSGWVSEELKEVENKKLRWEKTYKVSKKVFTIFSYSDAADAIDIYFDKVRGESSFVEEVTLEDRFKLCSYELKSKEGWKQLNDQIVSLARLAPDWCGEGSVVPKQEVINDFMQVLTSLPYNVKIPEIEVDDGSVSLEWGAQDGSASFALDCSGTGNVVGTLLSEEKSQQQAWRLKVRDYNNLANKLAMPLISKLLVGEL